MTIIRPLAVTDKLDIINLSQKIGTYDISIRPYEDCCTIFDPKNPKTAPKIDEVEEFEKKFDYEQLIYEAVRDTEVLYVKEEDKLIDDQYL